MSIYTQTLTNEGCRAMAIAAIESGDYYMAIAWYNSARARTIGHKKRDRYEALADGIAAKYNVPRHADFAGN